MTTGLDAVSLLGRFGVVPVVVLDDASHAMPLACALTRGGLPCAEITLRTPAALRALEITAEVDGFVAGAGTVLTAAQARQAIDAGAQFLVSPGLSGEVVEAGRTAGVPILPGVVTATELMAALDLGVTVVKFFPAATSGGTAALKALAAPFPDVHFMPTGGIGPNNLHPYLAIPAVIAVGGTWIATSQLLADGDFAAISQLAVDAVMAVAAHRPPATNSSRTAS